MIHRIGITNSRQALRSAMEFTRSAEAHFNAGRYQEAITDCDQLIRLRPQDDTPFFVRGNAKAELGHYKGL
jgi:tetratricopeptide (TPR) repeat protein